MYGELIRVITDDGLELQGMFCEPASSESSSRVAVFHNHGLSGNFYEQRLVSALGETLVEAGYAFLTANNRGHDYESDILKLVPEGFSEVHIGGNHEIFAECLLDLRAWLEFLARRGYDRVVLQGHSLGSMKVVHFIYKEEAPQVVGAVLISPPDLFGLQLEFAGDRFGDILVDARERVSRGDGDALLPEGAFMYDIDGKSYVSLFSNPSETDIFPYHSGDRESFKQLSSLRVPLLATMGTVEEAISVDPQAALDMIRSHASSAASCETQLFEGSPHYYLGFEEQLAGVVRDWLNSRLSRSK
jgi:pimeloyl-ACP methyl ester carboxylesterase